MGREEQSRRREGSLEKKERERAKEKERGCEDEIKREKRVKENYKEVARNRGFKRIERKRKGVDMRESIYGRIVTDMRERKGEYERGLETKRLKIRRTVSSQREEAGER